MNRFLISPPDSLRKINDYLLTFVGEIEVKLIDAGAQIIYPETNLTANLIQSQKSLTLTCQDNDSVTVNLIKNTGVRIYSVALKAFLPADANLLPVTQTNSIFKSYSLKPIFRYRNSLVFFCLDRKGRIHLINRHLLEYLNHHPDVPNQAEFSLVVAKNIGTFIALSDRGLIPLNYYQYSKIINQSGLDLAKTVKRIIAFELDPKNQAFTQSDRILTKIPKKYLAVKAGPDVGYELIKCKLTPYLNVSVYLE